MAETTGQDVAGRDNEMGPEPRPWRVGDTPLRRIADDLLPGQPAGVAARRLGRQVRAWREAHEMSQQDLAVRLGMAQPNVARLEGGGVAPTLTTLALLAERLGVRVTVAPGGGAPQILIEDAVSAA
jgi:DNA-binding XRE family transcriptional regulator